jgi:hypothetical protein
MSPFRGLSSFVCIHRCFSHAGFPGHGIGARGSAMNSQLSSPVSPIGLALGSL